MHLHKKGSVSDGHDSFTLKIKIILATSNVFAFFFSLIHFHYLRYSWWILLDFQYCRYIYIHFTKNIYIKVFSCIYSKYFWKLTISASLFCFTLCHYFHNLFSQILIIFICIYFTFVYVILDYSCWIVTNVGLCFFYKISIFTKTWKIIYFW